MFWKLRTERIFNTTLIYLAAYPRKAALIVSLFLVLWHSRWKWRRESQCWACYRLCLHFCLIAKVWVFIQLSKPTVNLRHSLHSFVCLPTERARLIPDKSNLLQSIQKCNSAIQSSTNQLLFVPISFRSVIKLPWFAPFHTLAYTIKRLSSGDDWFSIVHETDSGSAMHWKIGFAKLVISKFSWGKL